MEKLMKVGVISQRGLRPEMEDAHFLDLNFANCGWIFAGIYDGHCGRFAAEYASKRLHQIFLEKLLSGSLPREAFIASYETTSEELKNQDSGTTAVNFFIRDRDIFTANVGDARALVINKSGFHQLTVDHRLENPEERKRVEKKGGHIRSPYVYRGGMGLMPTRTIGDQYFKPVGVIATPSVSEYKIAEDDLVLLAACDGLFDVMTNEEVAEFSMRFSQPDSLVEALRHEVLIERFGTDNLTIIAVSLK
jgi:serine/threonine protein phosphatase PrpC